MKTYVILILLALLLSPVPGLAQDDEPEAPAEGFGLFEDDNWLNKSGAASNKFLHLNGGFSDSLEDFVPYATAEVWRGTTTEILGARYELRLEIGRPRSLPWEEVPPASDVMGRMDSPDVSATDPDNVLWLPLARIGFY